MLVMLCKCKTIIDEKLFFSLYYRYVQHFEIRINILDLGRGLYVCIEDAAVLRRAESGRAWKACKIGATLTPHFILNVMTKEMVALGLSGPQNTPS